MAKKRDELGYCGADCEECNIYRAMWFGEALRPETVSRWREDARKFWGVEALEEKQLNCRGCRHDKKAVFYGFSLCPIRKCCTARGLISCGVCEDWQSCQFYDTPEAQENIKNLAAME